MKKWILRPAPSGEAPLEWAEALHISPALSDLLWRRGHEDMQALDVYLSPLLRYLRSPSLWPGVQECAELLTKELLAGKKMLIWGDYDVDGVTSTGLVLDVLAAHGMTAEAHLPDRISEGYGLNREYLEKYAAEGVELLLTVDCGISDIDAITRARELGMTVLVSDHHQMPEALPPAHAICNPRMGDSPCPHLAGVGVAFVLMNAVNALLAEHTGRRCDMRSVLDLVALGTLADVVPLTGQNRILVKNGLLQVAASPRVGMAALKSVSGLHPSAVLGASQVVFALAPRINAAGRLGQASRALELLRCTCAEDAGELAHQLDVLNTRRRAEEDRIQTEALQQAETQKNRAGLVLYGEDWHSGVIGIVASRIVEQYNRPTLILCNDKGQAKGSGRSVNQFNLFEGLTQCADLLLRFGGHKLAAGLRLDIDKLDALRQRFDTVVRTALGGTECEQEIHIDRELDFALASDFNFLHELELMQPFGMGNAEPVFASPALRVKKRRLFGPSREHVKLELLDESCGITLHAKAWRQAASLPESMCGKRIRIAYTPRIDTFNGVASIDLRIRDWQEI